MVSGNNFTMLVDTVAQTFPTILPGTGSLTIVAANDVTFTGLGSITNPALGLVTVVAGNEIVDAADFYTSVPTFGDPTSVANYFDIWTGSMPTQATNIVLASGAFPGPWPAGLTFEGTTWPGIGTSGVNGALEIFLNAGGSGGPFDPELARDPNVENNITSDKNCLDLSVVDNVGEEDLATLANLLSTTSSQPLYEDPCLSEPTLRVEEVGGVLRLLDLCLACGDAEAEALLLLLQILLLLCG
jgi:hypothetical protein